MKDKKVDIPGLWKRVCSHHDEKAFESLFHLLNTSLVKFATMYVHRKELAEDIVADAFVKCWVNRKALSNILHFDTYLFVAVKNQSLNYIKKHSSTYLVRVEETNEMRLAKPYTPQEALEKKELFFKMEQSIAKLPPQCRIIFRLVKEEGLKYKEVAEIMNISPRTVQTQIFRAMRTLSAEIAVYLDANLPHPGAGKIPSLLLLIGAGTIFFPGL